MKSIDDHIRDALQREPGQSTAEDDWLSHYESLKALLRGQQKWLTVYQVSLSLVALVLAIVSAVQFFRVDSIREMIAWAAGFVLCVLISAIAQVWFYMEWNKCVARWDIKQLELQVAQLAENLVGPSEQATGKSSSNS